MSRDSFPAGFRPSRDPEAMLRKMLESDQQSEAVPQAKHKRYAKRAQRRRKSTGYDNFSDYPEEATRSHLLPPRERIDAIPEINLAQERERRASQAPPPMPAAAQPPRILNRKKG